MNDLEWIPSGRPFRPPTPADEQKGVGVLGLHEGRTMLLAMNRVSRARPVAACDADGAKIAAARRARPDVEYTTHYDAMLARGDVDIVAVYTPDALHAEHVVRAFDAGKDVLCTKPLVTRVDDARRLLEAARRTGRRLMVGQSTRFFEPFARQRRAYEAGEIGALELAEAHYAHRMDWFYEKSPWAASETDWVFLGMSHPLDLLRWYLGPIEEVHAYACRSELGRRYGIAGCDVYTIHVRAKGGGIGRAMGHYGCHELPSARNAIELMLWGAGGTSQAQYHDMRYRYTARDGAEVTEDALYAMRHDYFNSEVHGMHYGEFARCLEHFAGALIDGTPHHPNLIEGLETFCVMEAARRSARERRPVLVDDLGREFGL